MTRRFWLSLGGALVALAGTQPAYSFDYKIHPGSLCQAQLPDQAGNFQRAGGFIFNMGSPLRPSLTCPIIRDRVPHAGRTDELTPIDGGIHFNYVGGFGKPTCQWVSNDEQGRTMAVLPPTQTNDDNKGNLSMFWEIEPKDRSGNLQVAVDGTYSITCDMPPLAFLLRYVIGEQGSTDENGGF